MVAPAGCEADYYVGCFTVHYGQPVQIIKVSYELIQKYNVLVIYFLKHMISLILIN